MCAKADMNQRFVGNPKKTVDELKEEAEKLKAARQARGGQYDCIIGVSGGVDSSYVLYYAVRKLGLKPLALKYDHWMNHDVADRNFHNLCEDLGVDKRVVRSEQKNDLKYVKYYAKAMSTIGAYWGICHCCHYMVPTALFSTVLETKTPAMVSSDNQYEDDLHMDRAFRLHYMKNQLRKNWWKIPKLVFYMAIAQYYALKLKREHYLPPWKNLFSRYPKSPPIKRVNLVKYIHWDVDAMAEELERETRWQRPAGPRLAMRFDCMLEDSLINQTYLNACGLPVHCIISNNLIHHGLRTKDQLREACRHYIDEIPENIEKFHAHVNRLT